MTHGNSDGLPGYMLASIKNELLGRAVRQMPENCQLVHGAAGWFVEVFHSRGCLKSQSCEDPQEALDLLADLLDLSPAGGAV